MNKYSPRRGPLSDQDVATAIATLERFNESRVKPSQHVFTKRPTLLPRSFHVEALVDVLREGRSGERMKEFCARLSRRGQGAVDEDPRAFERRTRKALHDLSVMLRDWQELDGVESRRQPTTRVIIDPRCWIHVEHRAAPNESPHRPVDHSSMQMLGHVRALEVGSTPEALQQGIIQANALLTEGWKLLSVISRGQTGTCAFIFGR